MIIDYGTSLKMNQVLIWLKYTFHASLNNLFCIAVAGVIKTVVAVLRQCFLWLR